MKHIHFSKAFCCLVTIFVTSLAFSQDIIVTTDAQKIEAKILEVSKHEIKYKEKDNLNGPTFVLETNEISSILYSNGKVVLYNQKPEEKVNAEKETPKEPDIDPRLAEILLLSGETITAKISNMNSNYVEYELNETYYTLPASKIDKVTLLASGQVKTYVHYTEPKSTAEQEIGNNQTASTTKTSDNKKYPRYQGYLEFSGFFANVQGYTVGGIGLDGIDGVRFNKYVFLGLGIGLYGEWASTNYVSVGYINVPIFADLRAYIPTNIDDFYPYFETAIGPMINFYQRVSYDNKRSLSTNVNAYAFFRLNAGFDYKRFSFGVGYELWGNSSGVDNWGFIKLGVRLGKDTE